MPPYRGLGNVRDPKSVCRILSLPVVWREPRGALVKKFDRESVLRLLRMLSITQTVRIGADKGDQKLMTSLMTVVSYCESNELSYLLRSSGVVVLRDSSEKARGCLPLSRPPLQNRPCDAQISGIATPGAVREIAVGHECECIFISHRQGKLRLRGFALQQMQIGLQEALLSGHTSWPHSFVVMSRSSRPMDRFCSARLLCLFIMLNIVVAGWEATLGCMRSL